MSISHLEKSFKNIGFGLWLPRGAGCVCVSLEEDVIHK